MEGKAVCPFFGPDYPSWEIENKDRNWYIDECLRELNDSKLYKIVDKDTTSDIKKRMRMYVQRLHHDQIIDDDTKRFLIDSSQSRTILHFTQNT